MRGCDGLNLPFLAITLWTRATPVALGKRELTIVHADMMQSSKPTAPGLPLVAE